MVVAGRACWGVDAGAAAVGRVGARAGARAEERWRGIVRSGCLWAVRGGR